VAQSQRVTALDKQPLPNGLSKRQNDIAWRHGY
jgi:hypothetical protein